MFILVLLGILMVLFGIVSTPIISKNLGLKLKSTWLRSIAFVVVGVALMFVKSLFMWADASEQYLLVYPTGKIDAITEGQGIKYKGFAKVQTWSKWIDLRTPRQGDNLDGIEGVFQPVNIRFIDQVTGDVYLTTRFQLPNDKESFIALAIEFKSMQNLVNNTLIPTVREVVSNTGYMFAAQDYISGSANDFRLAIDDQLKAGTFSVEKEEKRDTIVSAITEDNRTIKEIQTRYEVNKRTDANGIPIRIPNDINENNIIVSQVIVDDVNLEEVFKERLEAQRDESAKRQLEQQKIKTAKDAQARIVAEGERDKAAERVTQEKEQVKTLIAIETKLKEEETNKKLAAIQLETERLTAQAKKVKADADAYQNAKLVQAGLTPQERAEWDYKTSVGVAEKLAQIKFPSTMIMGSDGKGTPLEALIGAAMANQLTNTKGN